MDVIEMPFGIFLLLAEGQHITVTFELQILETGAVLTPRMSHRAKGFGHSELVKRFSNVSLSDVMMNLMSRSICSMS